MLFLITIILSCIGGILLLVGLEVEKIGKQLQVANKLKAIELNRAVKETASKATTAFAQQEVTAALIIDA